MTIQEIDHVQVTVRDIAKAAAWYRDVLGFEDDGNWAIGNAYKHIKAGGVRITLGLPEHEAPHVAYCLDRESFEAKRADLTARGIATRFKRNKYADMLYFDDPDGNAIELFAWNDR
jgi:catechol 2,3-dioxygenase-like lactoylglutathione lyase family enzyme